MAPSERPGNQKAISARILPAIAKTNMRTEIDRVLGLEIDIMFRLHHVE